MFGGKTEGSGSCTDRKQTFLIFLSRLGPAFGDWIKEMHLVFACCSGNWAFSLELKSKFPFLLHNGSYFKEDSQRKNLGSSTFLIMLSLYSVIPVLLWHLLDWLYCSEHPLPCLKFALRLSQANKNMLQWSNMFSRQNFQRLGDGWCSFLSLTCCILRLITSYRESGSSADECACVCTSHKSRMCRISQVHLHRPNISNLHRPHLI